MVVVSTGGAGWSMRGVLAESCCPPLTRANTTTRAIITTATPRAMNNTVRRRGAGTSSPSSGSGGWCSMTSAIVHRHELADVFVGHGRRYGLHRAAPARAREGGQQRAEGDDAGT